ncbi:MAG: hypothetical protein IH820_11330 [Bacteroidetes bacterium]|nr:hypothetical protein [Bacteroidota bacterium]
MDGGLEVSGTTSTENIISTAVNNATIGTKAYTGAPDPGYFEGAIDDIRIYDRALTEAEIEALFVDGVEIPLEEQLAAIEDDVDALVNAGILSNGEGMSLVNKLRNAFSQLEKSKPDQAIKKLQDFIEEVNKLITQNKLTTVEGR